jgi:hypothetical protein
MQQGHGRTHNGGAPNVRRQPSPIGADFDPAHAVGQPQLFATPLTPGLVRASSSSQAKQRICEEMLDNTRLKFALQQLNTTPKEVVESLEHHKMDRRPSWCLLGSLGMGLLCLVLLLCVWLFSRSSHSLPVPSAPLLQRTLPIMPLWVGSEPSPRCGRAGIRSGAEHLCEPDLDALVSPVELERWRRGTCLAPESLSRWVCHQVLQDSPGRRLVDDYLLEEHQRQLRRHLLNSQEPLLRMARELCYAESDAKRSSNMLEQLRRQIISVSDWRSLSLVLGTAAAYRIDAFLCLGQNYTVMPCSTLIKTAHSTHYRGAHSIRNWLQYQPSSSSSVMVRFDGRQYGALDVASWLRGVSDGWTRTGLPSAEPGRSWLLMDLDYLRNLDLATIGTLDEWKSYLSSWIADESSNQRIQDMLAPFALEDTTADDLRYLEHLTRLIHGKLTTRHKVTQDLLQLISSAIEQHRPDSCADLFAVGRVVALWQNVSSKPTRSVIQPDEEPVTPPIEMLLPGVLYREPSSDNPTAMVDNFGRVGWRIALMVSHGNATEATLRAFQALCEHAPDRCEDIQAEDLPWIQRFLWNIAASNCGHQENSRLLDESIRTQLSQLYHRVFDCNNGIK